MRRVCVNGGATKAVGSCGELLTFGWLFPTCGPLSFRRFREVQRRTEGMLLCRSIVVLKQLIMDEPNLRPVEPELLYEFVSMVLCTPNAQLVSLTVDAF